MRHALDGADVEGDVLPRPAVTTGEGLGEPAVLVEQVDRQPVDLELAEVMDLGAPGLALDPVEPLVQLLRREGVVEAEHPLAVVDRGELGGEGAADLLRRALRGA